MLPNDKHWVEVDEQGRLILPAEVLEHYGLRPGARALLKEGSRNLRLNRPISQLARVYVEPTSRCNLACRTCIRNAWDEPQGDMTGGTFERLLESLKGLPSRPDVFLGGFGEPLLLSDIAGMVARIKAVAGKVELITNGVLLTKSCSQELIEAGLDMLWVSVDGVTPEHYADVRVGAALPVVLDNIKGFGNLRKPNNFTPEIGISFVAMRRNISDLPALIRLSTRLGVSRYMVTNVFPYTEEMQNEMLYTRCVDRVDSTSSPWAPRIDLPRIDLNPDSQEALTQTLRNRNNVRWNGVTLGQANGRCPFIERGSISIGWDGSVGPCLALMHSYTTFLNGRDRSIRRYILGNLADRELNSIWIMPEYVAFRKRVQEFDFAPCTWCSACDMAEKNEEDCFGNTFPACGGCLWAQGVIQCP